MVLLGIPLGGCGESSTSLTPPTDTRCEVSASPSQTTAPAGGVSGTLAISTARDCTWAASSEAGWVTITAGVSGQGNGTASYRVAANPDATPRQTRISVNDITVTVAQAAACVYTITPTTLSVGAGAEARVVQVVAGESCDWSSASQAPWITVTGRGAGRGEARLSIAANAGGARSGTVVVAGQTVRIEQAALAPCAFAIDPIGRTVGPEGGAVEVTVAAGEGCGWTASSEAPWVAVASGSSGTGPGTVTLTVAPSGTVSRTGIVRIAGQAFTVTQTAKACAYALSPTSAAVPQTGGSGTVDVHTTAGCDWTATSGAAAWLTVSPPAGSGEGTVRYTAAANHGPGRTGTVTIAGQTVTVTQGAAPCTFALAGSSLDIPAAGGSGTLELVAPGGCAWTATATVPWLTLQDPAAGSGAARVAFTVAANSAGSRSGTITIAGLTFTVNQAAAPCSVALDPPSLAFPSAGGTQDLAVTAGSWCRWSALAGHDWIDLTPSDGTGPGTVVVSVRRHNGRSERTSTIRVDDQSVSVVQRGRND